MNAEISSTRQGRCIAFCTQTDSFNGNQDLVVEVANNKYRYVPVIVVNDVVVNTSRVVFWI